MRPTSSIDADISRTDVDVSSAFAESSSIDVRTLLIDWSIWLTEAEVVSVETSCSPALLARMRERPLIWLLTVETSVASWPKRRMVRSRLEARARLPGHARRLRRGADLARAQGEVAAGDAVQQMDGRVAPGHDRAQPHLEEDDADE